MANGIVVKLTWEDISTGDTDETGQELDIYTDSASFVPTVPIDYAGARHPWMRLPPLAAGVETLDLPLKTPVTFVKFRVRQYNANGPGPWSLARVVTIAQAVGVLVPQAPINLGGVVSGGTVTPPPPPVDPPPPPPPTGGGGASSNYVFTSQFSSTQGSNQWSYKDANGTDLTYNSTLGYYTGAQPYQVLWNGGIHPGTTVGTVLRWTAPAAGVALVSGSVNLASAVGSNGVTFTIKHDAATIDGPVSLTTTAPYTISESVTVLAAGEVIDFIVAPISGNSYCNTTLTPAINFTTDGSTPANPTVSALSPSSLGVSVGAVQSLTVTLSSAPASVASVSVSSSDPTKATVPATVSVAAGQLSANIPVTGVAAGSSTITATYNSSNKTAAVTVSNPASGSWSNAPAGGTVLKDTPLNDIVGFIDDYPVPGNHIETISDAIFSPTKGLVHRLDPFARTGGGQVRFVAPTLYRELYAGMYWRSNPQFQGRIVVNKMFFLRSSSIQSNGFIGWMARNPSGNASGPLVFAVNGGASNQHILGPTSDSGSFFFPNVGNGNVSAGVWYKLEWRLRASTTMTSQDGAYQLWINGVLVSSYLNINYSNGTGLDEWVMNQTWDGSGDMGSSNTVTWEHYLDHLMLVGKN